MSDYIRLRCAGKSKRELVAAAASIHRALPESRFVTYVAPLHANPADSANRERLAHATRSPFVLYCEYPMNLSRVFAAGLFLIPICSGAAGSSWPTAAWPRSLPEEQGMSSLTLEAGDRFIVSRCPRRFSFLVVRNGRLVFERYYHGKTNDSATHVMSISKSVLSILVGQALDEKYIDTLEHKVMDYYPEYAAAFQDPGKKEITLKHLLTMTAGFRWNELHSAPAWVASRDWFRFILDLPLSGKPGELFNYNTGLSHLLAGVLAKSTGANALAFGKRRLFEPLGVRNFRWEKDRRGYFIGGFHMYFTPADLAKFGYLYLRKGVWEERQLVSPGWVEASTRLQVPNTSALNIGDYGYHWWVRKVHGHPAFMAAGFGGQYIFVVPELDLVTVTTADSASDSLDLHKQAFDLLNLYVIPAIRTPPAGPIERTRRGVRLQSDLQGRCTRGDFHVQVNRLCAGSRHADAMNRVIRNGRQFETPVFVCQYQGKRLHPVIGAFLHAGRRKVRGGALHYARQVRGLDAGCVDPRCSPAAWLRRPRTTEVGDGFGDGAPTALDDS